MIAKCLKPTIVLLLLANLAFGQRTGSPIKGSALGVSGNMTDFLIPDPGKRKPDAGFSLMYWRGLTNIIDVSVRYNGILSGYTKNPGGSTNDYINEFEASLHARPWGDNRALSPFLSAGIGIGDYTNSWSPYVPIGGGIQLSMKSDAYVFLQTNYRFSLKEAKVDNNIFYSLGVAQTISKRKAPEPKPIPVAIVEVKDSDNDGIPDATDACPEVAGSAALKGCPDKDGDGIADKDDKCPDVAGLARYEGCPIPDTDKDAINDEVDKCPSVAGVAKYDGCPIPASDKDGVNDEEDKCPNLPGTVANNGCPEIKEEVKKKVAVAASNIYFATGSAKLLAKSFKSLDNVAKILQDDSDLKLDVNGHTDNTGKADKNQVLSENKAKSVYDYLAKQGVPAERLKSAGFGQDQPIADNKTSAGRSKNRRVELNLHYD